ncbi:RimK/LysX family protein [Paraglaciecola aquimarina]|uniref:RimK/LysX family protein n=1 Tax=Paraglaciecola aquimarina TaxID=1235557 RepID=A0ABU3SXE1_9ALTE|nr:RimK/LysX family protein [Paraglaciecola aquimarina]MDU0354671.1 RimK/LysX family protein [Paraglaciecola aquimarina]
MQIDNKKHLVGALELCDLPDLSLTGLEARVDTGATTSSLHVDNIKEFQRDNKTWISFDIHPDTHDVNKLVQREAIAKSQRKVKSSNGTYEHRYVIETNILIAGMQWKIQLTLTDRSSMKYLMLLGRETMAGRLIVDPEHEFLLTKND